MTDDSAWSPPEPARAAFTPPASAPTASAPASAPPASAPAFAPPASAPTAARISPSPTGPPFGAPTAGAPAPRWAPPPRPGLFPLRPLDYGTILGAPYRLLRRNPKPTFGASLVVQGGVSLVGVLVVGLVAYLSLSRIPFADNPTDENTLIAGAVGITLLASIIPIALSIFATGVMQGIIVLEVARQSLAERQRFGQLWRRARGRLFAVGGYSLAVTAVAGVLVGVIVAMIVGLSLLGTPGIIAAVLLGLLAGLGLVVGIAFLATKLAFVPSVIVIERASIRTAMARSWRLTRRSFWKTLGTTLLVWFILTTAVQIIGYPIQLGTSIVGGLVAPTGETGSMTTVLIVGTAISLILSLVLSSITVVIQAATTALLYIDQRIRKEGLDLDLARFVEARQSAQAAQASPSHQFGSDRFGSEQSGSYPSGSDQAGSDQARSDQARSYPSGRFDWPDPYENVRDARPDAPRSGAPRSDAPRPNAPPPTAPGPDAPPPAAPGTASPLGPGS